MPFGWYGHLKTMGDQPWSDAAWLRWGIALFEYLLQVPVNRIGFTLLSLPQFKITKEVIFIGGASRLRC